MFSRRRFIAAAAGGAASGMGGALSGCALLNPCTAPALPPGVASPGEVTYGEIRRCAEETAAGLRPFAVAVPPDAPSIISDYGSWLDTNLAMRPFPHTGIDIAGEEGKTPVIAAMDGFVEEARHVYSGGNYVALFHGQDGRGNDLITIYFHLARILARPGAEVARGAVLGLVGNSGTTAGSVPHLHYSVFVGPDLRRRHFSAYFYTAHQDPHRYWHDGPGRVTLFKPGARYGNRQGATYPAPGRGEAAYFERLTRGLPAI
jgi:murein DD-endopeptidase MepM/ murein hydrolase activator NlpD